MKIDSSIVGATIRETTFDVSWRHTTNYAAAVGDLNPRYLDDSREGGIVAPPLFATAVTWPVSLSIRDHVDAEGFPWDVMATQVHYTEHLAFHRPVRPGERLEVGGCVAGVVPHPKGTILVVRYLASTPEGETVFVEHSGALLRGVDCEDGGSTIEGVPSLTSASADSVPAWDVELPVGRSVPYVYDGCSGISFPIHTSPSFARAVGLPGIIVQGTATLAMAAREVLDREAGCDPARLSSISCRFTGLLLPGSSIRVIARRGNTSSDGYHLHFDVLDNKGKAVLSSGEAVIA